MVAINTIKMSESDPEDERRRALLRQQAFADLLSQTAQRAGGDKVYGHGLGLAKVGGAALAGLWGRQADEQEKSEQAAADELIASTVGRAYGQGAGENSSRSDAISPAIDETGDGGKARDMAYARASAGIESGGNYAALGPVTKGGDRAYGKHQVMGANIPAWSKEALGRSLTPQEFLNDKEAQDAIFKAKFGQYAQKYGPEGAARAWFAGERGMNNSNARDQLGTTVAQYGQRFMRGLGQDAPANPTSTPSAPSPAPAAGISAQDIQALVRNPRTRSYGLALYNAHVQEIAQRQQQQAEIAKEQRQQGYKREEIELQRDRYVPVTLPDGSQGQRSERTGKIDVIRPTDTLSPEAQEQRERQRAAGRNQQSISVGGGTDKQVFDSVEKTAEAARAARTGLSSIQEARKAVQAGGIFGKGAEGRLGLQKLAVYFGADPKEVVNTETFRSAIAPQVSAMIKSTVGATNISNSDREFALSAAGGSIELDEKSILRLLDIQERAQMNVLDEHQKRIDTIYPDGPQYQRERALFSIQPPSGAPVRVQSPEEVDKLPPNTRFMTPDGRIGTVPAAPMTPAAPPVEPRPPLPGTGPLQGAPRAPLARMPYNAYPLAGIRG